jgi:hypothetical protein
MQKKRKKGIPSKTKSPPANPSAAMLKLAVALLEPLDATCGVDQLLLAGEKRVAGRTDLGIDFRLGRTGFKGVAAKALYRNIDVFGVDSFFHFQALL